MSHVGPHLAQADLGQFPPRLPAQPEAAGPIPIPLGHPRDRRHGSNLGVSPANLTYSAAIWGARLTENYP